MKSIDEMSIPDLLYRVRYSILPCYGQEILSRFAEQERLIGKLQVQLAGCGVAADQNTEESIKNRITPDNEYYSASYQSVCNAVDREIALRKRIAELEKENEDYKFVMNTNNSNYIYDLKRRIAELEATVERMKCCGNCKEFHHCQFRLKEYEYRCQCGVLIGALNQANLDKAIERHGKKCCKSVSKTKP